MRYAIVGTVFFFTLACASISLSAATIPVFGTGLNALGQFLAPGTTDPHYTLTVNFLNTGSGAVVPNGANPMEASAQGVPQGWPFLPGVYASDTLAQWIAPQADIVAIPGIGVDTLYTYQTTFNLNGFDLSTVQLTGHWTADNFLSQVLLNGSPVFTGNTSCASGGAFSFQTLTPFTISGGFQGGVNTLSFNVTNAGCANTPPNTNPTALLVDISGSGAPLVTSIPEPGTMLSAAMGLVLAGWFYRLRRKIRA